MKLEMLKSSPLRPIATRLKDLTSQCREVWVATAFVSSDAVEALVTSAMKSAAGVRILTGTFGNSTRKATFARLLSYKKVGVETKVWACATHGDFHAKLYIWKLPRERGIAWIGSANLTDGGMQNEGELIAQLSGPWTSPEIALVRRAFEAEWRTATDLDEAFLRTYKEAKRRPGEARKRRAASETRACSRFTSWPRIRMCHR